MKDARVYGLGLAAGLLEVLAWNLWVQGRWLAGTWIHLASSLLLAASKPKRELALWAGTMALTAPGAGWLIGYLIQSGPRSSDSNILEEFREHTRPRPVPVGPQPLRMEEQLARALTTSQNLNSGDPSSARHARDLANSVSALGDAAKVRRLLALLKDPQSDAYHVAAAKISRLQEQLAVAVFRANQTVHGNPQSIEAQEALAEAYVNYLRSGLMQGPLADFYYRLAVQRFQMLANLDPDSPRWELRVAELHRRNGRYHDALLACERILARWPDHAETRMRILEIYYYGARLGVAEATRHFYQMLQRLGKEIDPSEIEDPWLRRAARWWFEGDPVRA